MENNYLIPLDLPAEITLNVTRIDFLKRYCLCISVCSSKSHNTAGLPTVHDAAFSLSCNNDVAIAFKIKLLGSCIAQW